MYVKCYELMKVPAFKNIQLIAGGSGLNRLVSWVYVLTTPYLEGWVHGGESLINDEMIELANKENFPLFEMDYNIKLLDVTRDISAYIMQKQEKVDYLDCFFQNILFSANLEKKNIDDFSLY